MSFALGRPLAIAIVLAAVARVSVFAYAFFFPITNEVGMPVSPTLVQPWIEFEFYQRSLELYQTLSVRELLGLFTEYYSRPFGDPSGHLIGGPVFPALIGISGYEAGNTVPLAVFYLVLSFGVAWIWLNWLAKRGVGALWLWAFALLPNPFWFMLNLSTDLAFAFLVMLFYLAYFRDRWRTRDVAAWVVLIVLCVLTRPNGAAILLFVFLDFAWRSRSGNGPIVMGAALLGIGGLVTALYLFPYFITEMTKVSSFRFFGLQESEYLAGLYDGLPIWLNLPLSWASLVGAKLAYFVGLRPSDAGIGLGWLTVRAAAGVVLLPGLIYTAVRGDRRVRLFVWVYFLPIFLGPTQDRYNLAIQPLLFFYGAHVLSLVWSKFQGRGDTFRLAEMVPTEADESLGDRR